MTGFLDNLIGRYRSQAKRNRNRPFLRGTMAACSLVATADGQVSFGERVRVDQVLQTLDALRVFDPHEGVDQFNDFTDVILKTPSEGRPHAIEAMRAAATNRETAELLIRICLAVSEANGVVSLADEIEIVTLCSLLGIEPTNLGLYPDRSAADLIGE